MLQDTIKMNRMLTKLRREQLITILDNYKCSDARTIQNIITEMLHAMPVKPEYHGNPCVGCTHWGHCRLTDRCMRGVERRDYYQSTGD